MIKKPKPAKWFTSLVILLLIGSPLHSQTFIDSVALIWQGQEPAAVSKAYDRYFKTLIYRDIDQARQATDSMNLYAKASGDQNLMARATNNTASYFYMQNELDTALTLYQAAIAKYRAVGNLKEVSGIMMNVGNCYGEKGNLPKSMETHVASLRIQDELGIDGIPKAKNLLNLGVLHSEMKSHREALDYGRRALHIYEREEDERGKAEVKYNIAVELAELDSVDLAQEILAELIIYHRKEEEVYDLVGALLESGKNYVNQERYELGEKQLQEAINIAKASDDEWGTGTAYNKLVILYLKKKDFEQAEKYALLSYQREKNAGDLIDQTEDLYNLAIISAKLNKFKKAYNYQTTYHALHDSLLGIQKVNLIRGLELKYESEKKDQEILLLSEKEKRSQMMTFGLLVLIVLLATAIGAIIYAFRQRIIKNKIAKEKVDNELDFNTKELELRKQELTAYALQLAHKNEILGNVKDKVSDLGEYNQRSIQQIINTIDINKNSEESWDGFRQRFTAVHQDFEAKVQELYPSINSNELRLMTLLKMNLNTKEIAEILNISPDGAKKARYRLRKKMGLKTKDVLVDVVMGIS